jgi:hypothetical protein
MSTLPLTESEAFVYDICRRSFLSLWCYNNPRGKDGKELCDILVVCDPHVIILSVKDITLKVENEAAEFEKWTRKAVEASIKQLYGAARWLASASQITRSDGSPGLALPPLSARMVHRVAVAFGGRGEVPISSGDFGKGLVHVMSETSFHEVMTELDTITDLVEYLEALQVSASSGCTMIVEGSESNLLGWYLSNERSFPKGQDVMILDDTIWKGLQERPEFKRRKEADRDSYFWDKLIEGLSDPNAKPIGESGAELSEFELALRVMAREPRFYRRGLGRHAHEFFDQAKAGKLRSRILNSPSGVIYVLAFFSQHEDLKNQSAELGARCLIARHQIGKGDTVIGIGIGRHVSGKGSVSTLCYVKCPNWSAQDDAQAVKMKSSMGFFAKSALRHSHEDEYPTG